MPRPAHSDHEVHSGLQADPQLGRVLARRPGQCEPATHLRHGVGVAGGARPPSGADRGGAAARPPQARRRAGPVQLSRRNRFRPSGFPPQGRNHPARARGLFAPQAQRGGLRVRQQPAHHQGGAVQDLRPPRLVRRRHVPADAPRRRVQRGRHGTQAGPGLLPQADELPDALPDLPVAWAVVSRTSVAALRVRHRLSIREVRCRARADPGARADDGRRAHLLHPRADARRADLAAELRARPAGRLRPDGLLSGAVDQGPEEVRRLRRDVGGSHQRAGRGRRGVGS